MSEVSKVERPVAETSRTFDRHGCLVADPIAEEGLAILRPYAR